MSVHLSHGRAEIVCLACKGHSFLMTGRGGTGKSSVVKEASTIFERLERGFCDMFQEYSMHDPDAASTVHSYYGSGIADLSRGQLSD